MPESGNTHRFTQNNIKKISNGKTPGHDGIHGFWFKKFTFIHDRQALEMNTLIHAVRIYNQDIGMNFGIEKCAMLVMKSGKRHLTDGMELPSQDKIRKLREKESNKYSAILEADTIK